jgi:hypothetical protein
MTKFKWFDGPWPCLFGWRVLRVVTAERELQVPRLPPDFLSGFVVSIDLMRLSLKEAAYVAVD